jgi:phosphoribosyl 1,2-cyclic phosphate phosphodiesterase
MQGSFLFLGTGASVGIPLIGCKCAVCTSPDPKNRRLRPSGLLRIGGKSLLLDVGPDFRAQALHFGIEHLDGLLLTHTHYDHIAGIDELRIFYVRQKKPFPCLMSQETLDTLKVRYAYLFMPLKESITLSAQLDVTVLNGNVGVTDFLGVKIGFCSYLQGGMKVTGFRVGRFAYISDIREYDKSIFSALDGVEELVLSALREEPSQLHFSLDEAVEFSRKVGAKKTHLTHIAHFLDHESTNQKLPSNVQLAYDGLKVEFGI